MAAPRKALRMGVTFLRNFRVFMSRGLSSSHRTSFSKHSEFTSRSHTCGELKLDNVGERVTLCGWLQFRRLKFAILRDGYGSTQLLFPAYNSQLAENIPLESIIEIRGTVSERPSGQENNKMATGAVEVVVEDLLVLNKSETSLPFLPRDFQNVNEQLRLQYRYIDLRNSKLQENLRLRSNVVMKMRDFLCNNHGFVDLETPTLFRRTPGGAQEFVVPTQQPNLFYSLTQSPQQFKQLLMIGSFDRYFQIARCYRDETGRPDRQPEFTQVDIEMSFTNSDGVMSLVEKLLTVCWPKHLPQPKIPFRRMKYAEAVDNYGTDKPDTRFDLKLKNIPKSLTDSIPFLQPNEFGKAVVITNFSDLFTRAIEQTFKYDAEFKHFIKKLLIAKVDENLEWTSTLNKHVDEVVRKQVNQELQLRPKDVLLCAFGKSTHVLSLLGKLRLLCADHLEAKGIQIRNDDDQNFLWITDFPLFQQNSEGKLESSHHPFTAPHQDDVNLIYTNPEKVRGQHYDLVLNGAEIGGGSIRIHNADLQKYVLHDVLQEDTSQLTHLIDALKSGCPPHGGIALGLDRLIAIMCKTRSIRDVIAFPKSMKGKDFMSDSPAEISLEDKKLYHLK